MNSKERMRLAMHFKKPDRVPVMCPLSVGHILVSIRKRGVTPVDYYFSPEVCAEVKISLMKEYSFDGVNATPWSGGTNDPDWKRRVKNTKTDERGQWVYWKDGRYTFYEYGGEIRNSSEVKLPSINEIKVEEVEKRLEKMIKGFTPSGFKMLDIVIKRVGEEYSVHSGVGDPFDFLMHQMGVQNAMISLYDNPGKAKELIELGIHWAASYGIPQIEMGVDALVVSAPLGGSSFISRNFYKEFIQPSQKKLLRLLRQKASEEKREVPIYLHTCGFLNDRLEIISQSGFDGIECLDPPPLGDVELADAKKRIGDKMFIKGNIDSVNTLLKKSKEEVIEDAKKRIEIAGPGGGYILSTACSVAPNVPQENIKVLSEVAKEYGRYPLLK